MNSKVKIHKLIDRYFGGETTLSEEKWLRSVLPGVPEGDPKVEEALAVMGFSRSGRRVIPAPRGRSSLVLRYVAVAAAVLMLGVIAIWLSSGDGNKSSTECYAYVGGKRIDNERSVRYIMDAQLDEMGDCSDELQSQIQDDFSDFKNLMDL